jgi:hypothetical protein
VNEKNKEIALCRLALTQSVDRGTAISIELDEAQSKLQSPFRNPFIMTTVGVILGLVVGGIALK